MNKIYLSIVIPCYNEERNIRLGALENVAHYLKKKTFSYEVLLVDDGSTDDSKKLIRSFIEDHPQFYQISRHHQGKAATVTAGISQSKGELILFTDLDQATPINQMEKLIPFIRKGFSIVIGSRSGKRRGAPILRRMMARGFMVLRNVILDLGIEDTQCGFKLITKEAAREIFPRLKVHNLEYHARGSTVTAGFDVELLFIARMLGFKIAEVPVDWHYQETRHINPVKDSIEGIIDLLRIRLNCLFGIYKTK